MTLCVPSRSWLVLGNLGNMVTALLVELASHQRCGVNLVFFDESLQQASFHDFDIVKRLMPYHDVEVLHLKDAKFNKHIPNSKEITSSSFMSYKQ